MSASNQKGSMQKTLSLWNFFTIGFGAIIGTGWVLMVGDWMIIGGGPVAAMIAFIIGAVFGELTAAIPISGGIVEYVDRTYGNTMSYITGWFLALGNAILCPWEAIAISTLVSDMFGDLFPILRSIKLYSIMGADVYLLPTVIALSFAVYVIIQNFRGASAAASLQAFLTKALLCGMILAMGISLIKGGPENIQPIFASVEGAASSTSASTMFAGIISVLVMTPFFYAGFDTIPQQAEEAAEGLDWNKFGRVISLALLASGGFYMVCIYSFGSIIPWTDFVKSSVPAYGATSRIMLAMGRKGQLPRSFAEVDPVSGTPKTANILLAVLTVIGPFLGKKMLVPLTNVSALAFIFACTMVSFSCYKMRLTEPDLPRPYKVPGGKFGISLACLAGSLIVLLMIVPGSLATLNAVEWSIVLGWLAIGLIIKTLHRNKTSGSTTISISIDDTQIHK